MKTSNTHRQRIWLFAEFLSSLADTNGLVALQEDNDDQRFQEFLTLQQALIDSGVLNTTTLTDAVANSDGLLSELRDVLTATSQDLIDAQDQTVDNVLNLADIQQSLLDSNDINFESLIQLTDSQRQQIVDNLNALTGVTSNIDIDSVAQLNQANSWLRSISISLDNLRGASKDYFSTLVNDDRRKVSLPGSHYANQQKMVSALESLKGTIINDGRIKVSLPGSHYINQNKTIDWLKTIDTQILNIRDKGILDAIKSLDRTVLEIADKSILSVITSLRDNQLAQNRGIAGAVREVNDSIQNLNFDMDTSKLDVINESIIKIADQAILLQAKGTNSLLSQLVTNQLAQNRGIAGAVREVNQSVTGIADKGILLELQGINDSIINIHDMAILSVLEELKNNQWNQNRGIAGAIRDLDDTNQKVSLPTSHYNNQQVAINQNQAIISEMKKMNLKLRELTSNSYHQGESIRENTRDIEKIVQNIELNGLRVRA